MRVGSIGGSSGIGYVGIGDRIETSIISSISRARRAGKKEIVMILRECPATYKALDSMRENFDIKVETNESKSVKVTISWA